MGAKSETRSPRATRCKLSIGRQLRRPEVTSKVFQGADLRLRRAPRNNDVSRPNPQCFVVTCGSVCVS
jgi:hypothetical protein